MTRDTSRMTLARALAGVEIGAWIALFVVTLLTAASTLASEFPARSAALLGECVVALSCASLMAWALHGRRRLSQADARGLALRGAASVVRVAVLGPILLFALVVAAAGFSA